MDHARSISHRVEKLSPLLHMPTWLMDRVVSVFELHIPWVNFHYQAELHLQLAIEHGSLTSLTAQMTLAEGLRTKYPG